MAIATVINDLVTLVGTVSGTANVSATLQNFRTMTSLPRDTSNRLHWWVVYASGIKAKFVSNNQVALYTPFIIDSYMGVSASGASVVAQMTLAENVVKAIIQNMEPGSSVSIGDYLQTDDEGIGLPRVSFGIAEGFTEVVTLARIEIEYRDATLLTISL